MQRKIYVKDIEHDEMRDGFLVTSHRKKLWNVQLNLIVEFDRICRKHNIKWSVACGSLLGAARHKGFIPWDDDIDIMVMRPDYERLKKILPSELDRNYFVDMWYNYVHEGEPNPEGFPSIKLEHMKKYPWLPFSPFTKLRDLNTTYLKYVEIEELIQGLFIDIFPFDPVPPFNNPEHEKIFWTGEELRRAVTYPDQLKEELRLGKPLYTSHERLKEILSLPFRDRALIYENYLADNFFDSEYVSFITFNALPKDKPARIPSLLRKYYTEIIRLPFEGIEVCAPADYDALLTMHYGDWRTPKMSHIHAQIYSTDISYKDYFVAQTR